MIAYWDAPKPWFARAAESAKSQHSAPLQPELRRHRRPHTQRLLDNCRRPREAVQIVARQLCEFVPPAALLTCFKKAQQHVASLPAVVTVSAIWCDNVASCQDAWEVSPQKHRSPQAGGSRRGDASRWRTLHERASPPWCHNLRSATNQVAGGHGDHVLARMMPDKQCRSRLDSCSAGSL